MANEERVICSKCHGAGVIQILSDCQARIGIDSIKICPT